MTQCKTDLHQCYFNMNSIILFVDGSILNRILKSSYFYVCCFHFSFSDFVVLLPLGLLFFFCSVFIVFNFVLHFNCLLFLVL